MIKKAFFTETRLPDDKYCHVGEKINRDCNVCRCIPGIGFVKCSKFNCSNLTPKK